MMPPIPPQLEAALHQVNSYPGTTVLDLPFCVAGGNGVCTAEQCPNYPYSTVAQCLRLWHDKKIYGLYQARMTEGLCDIYRRKPYQSWFSAWQQQRCFTDQEWAEFCGYLDQHPELSAIQLYPDIWIGAGQPQCLAQFDAHLGSRLNEVVMPRSPSFGGKWTTSSRILFYPPKCLW